MSPAVQQVIGPGGVPDAYNQAVRPAEAIYYLSFQSKVRK